MAVVEDNRPDSDHMGPPDTAAGPRAITAASIVMLAR